ncbi:sigma-E processing peptidase SpoIIGA [Peribacillus sp. SCS-37]|uniref:sigma-E processing peptidase SpoIIGA n=1 Tax=Paraperibacillus esterisolvens TaxID=3115296 RepID=UPI0039069EA6
MYLDVVWLLNLLFDSLLLYGAALVLKRKAVPLRIGLGGLIGSIIIVLNFTPLYPLATHPAGKLLFSVLMTLTAFGYKRFSYFMKGLMALYLITFLMGGSMLGAHYLFQSETASYNTQAAYLPNAFGDPVSWLFVIIGFPLSWMFSKRNLESLEMTKIKYDRLVSVYIKIGDFEAAARGMVDSGNSLHDPLTRTPVMIFSLKGYEAQLPEGILAFLEKPDDMMAGSANISWAPRLRLIPSKAIGVEHQLLAAFKPDIIQIEISGKPAKIKGLVSFTLQQLSPDEEFAAILHPKMMLGGETISA